MSLPSSEPVAAAAQQQVSAGRKKGRGWNFGRFLRARIGAQSLTVELFAGRNDSRLLASLEQGYGGTDGSPERGLPTELAQAIAGLAPALAALQAKLDVDRSGSLRGLVCDVVIDDSWMLYDVVRADLRGLSPRAADALIAASLADVAGVAATELVSRWQPQGTDPFTLACGLPASALPALQEALGAFGVVAGSIEGEFVFEYNRVRDRLEPKCAVIALVREAGAQLAVLIDGVLTSMSFEFGVDAPAELETRGRSLLRVAGVAGEESIRFYAMSPSGWNAPAPWVSLRLAA